MPAIGASVPRKEGRRKVTGEARYVDDLALPGMLHGITVRSPAPRGIIRDIEFQPGVPWDEIIVVTADDIPGTNVVALILDDQPYLAERQDQPSGRAGRSPRPSRSVCARRGAPAGPHSRRSAAASVHIEESLGRREVIWGSDNVFKTYLVQRGDVDAAFRTAAQVIEGEYHTGAQEQLYIEPNGMLAVADAQAGVTVWGSMQCPYYIHRALAGLFDLPSERIRVVQMETGGGFGGKEEYPSILAGHAALLAWKSGRPVKMVYDRARGHGRHDQAASRRERATAPRSTPTAGCWPWTSSSSSTAAPIAR